MRKILIYILISLTTISCGSATGVLTTSQIVKRDNRFQKEQDRLSRKYYRDKAKRDKEFAKRKTK